MYFSGYRNNKKNIKNKKKQKEETQLIVVLAKSRLNSIENLISQALIDLEVIHEEFKIIVNEKEKCEKMKKKLEWWKAVMN